MNIATTHTLVIGDSRQLSLLPDKSVQLIITSPPYWQLKDYDNDHQIGFHDSYEEYINNLNLVWQECYRVLADGCRMCINIGDQFARAVYYGRYKVIPIRTEIIRFCETIGLDYMGAIIWQKQTTMNTTGGASVMGSYPYPRNGIIKIDYEFILIFKKLGKSPMVTIEQKAASVIDKEEWNKLFSSHWTFAGARQEGHIATFPEELPSRLIRMFSFVGETVLDPFMGSGTTALAARHLQRHSIGYEINGDFLAYYKAKVMSHSIFDRTEFVFRIDDGAVDIAQIKRRLPYFFTDPHKMDSKINIKQLQFGSRIDKESREREDYFTVREILSPNTLLLSNGITIRLLGIKARPSLADEAKQYLINTTQGKRVYMRYDEVKYDADNTLLCYLYLQNKTFINAHLLKHHLAEVDYSFDFRYRTKFETLTQQ